MVPAGAAVSMRARRGIAGICFAAIVGIAGGETPALGVFTGATGGASRWCSTTLCLPVK
jgi:hypothetical protein